VRKESSLHGESPRRTLPRRRLSERTPATIKNYRGDLDAFAAWFTATGGDDLEPEKITPTDLRELKSYRQEERNLWPTSVNRKLATLKSSLG